MTILRGTAVQPQLRDEIELRDKALSGDMVFSITPATIVTAPTSALWTRDIVIEVQDAAGNLHTWLDQAYTTKLVIANTSTAGTATIASTTLTLEQGRAVITVSGDALAWLATETDTLTVADITVMGYTITGGTSVETFTA